MYTHFELCTRVRTVVFEPRAGTYVLWTTFKRERTCIRTSSSNNSYLVLNGQCRVQSVAVWMTVPKPRVGVRVPSRICPESVSPVIV